MINVFTSRFYQQLDGEISGLTQVRETNGNFLVYAFKSINKTNNYQLQ